EEAARLRTRRAAQASVISATIEALVRQARHFRRAREGHRTRQNSLTRVGMKANALSLTLGEGSRLVPHAAGDGHRAEIVNQGRLLDGPLGFSAQSEHARPR